MDCEPAPEQGQKLRLQDVCAWINNGDALDTFQRDKSRPIDFDQLVEEYVKEFLVGKDDKYMEFDSVEMMCPGISGQFLDMVLEARSIHFLILIS